MGATGASALPDLRPDPSIANLPPCLRTQESLTCRACSTVVKMSSEDPVSWLSRVRHSCRCAAAAGACRAGSLCTSCKAPCRQGSRLSSCRARLCQGACENTIPENLGIYRCCECSMIPKCICLLCVHLLVSVNPHPALCHLRQLSQASTMSTRCRQRLLPRVPAMQRRMSGVSPVRPAWPCLSCVRADAAPRLLVSGSWQ